VSGGGSFVCDTCGAAETFVKDTRPTRFGEHSVIRRRRLCAQCKVRFTTIEIQADALERLAGGDPDAMIALVRDVEQAVQRLGGYIIPKRRTGPT